MITAKELYDATIAGTSSLAKHARENPDMPVFLLLGQDQHASELVDKWSIWTGVSIPSAGGKELHKKVERAKAIADLMRAWPIHKAPD